MFQKRFAAAAALILALVSSNSYALSNASNCFMNYYNCVNTAANLDGFWKRGAAGLDCALDLAHCVKDNSGW